MAKLHEVLAVESGLQTTAKKTNEETIKTFGKKDEHFLGSVKRTEYFDADEGAKLNTREDKAMVTTVVDKLLYNTGPNVRALDAYLQKADITVDDKILFAQVPATVLLGLETKLTELRAVYEAIPTLAPGATWEPDTNMRKSGVYRSKHSEITFRSKRIVKPVVMAPATEHHPAQVQAIQEDVPVARIVTDHWSGMITSAQKSDLLGRLDKLLRAIKRARQRANSTEIVKSGSIGKTLFDYIHGDIVA
jgi:hypothetical protein